MVTLVWKGGFGMTPWCIVLSCSWPIAIRPSLGPFPSIRGGALVWPWSGRGGGGCPPVVVSHSNTPLAGVQPNTYLPLMPPRPFQTGILDSPTSSTLTSLQIREDRGGEAPTSTASLGGRETGQAPGALGTGLASGPRAESARGRTGGARVRARGGGGGGGHQG